MVLAREAIGGYVVKADNFVQRVDADQDKVINFYAWNGAFLWPIGKLSISLQKPTAMTPISSDSPIYYVPGNNYPVDGISYDNTITTNENGFAEKCLTGNRVNQPRFYLPGQMYFLSYVLPRVNYDKQSGLIAVQVNIHLRSYFPILKNQHGTISHMK